MPIAMAERGARRTALEIAREVARAAVDQRLRDVLPAVGRKCAATANGNHANLGRGIRIGGNSVRGKVEIDDLREDKWVNGMREWRSHVGHSRGRRYGHNLKSSVCGRALSSYDSKPNTRRGRGRRVKVEWGKQLRAVELRNEELK
jgi:hypothetical protein